jgi:hypothetical protein
MFVPIPELLPPELLRENLFRALKPLGDFGLRGWHDLTVAEAVYVAHLEAVEEQPIEAREVVGALLEGGGLRLLPIARHWARHVHRVLRPRSCPWRLKMESGCHALCEFVEAFDCAESIRPKHSPKPRGCHNSGAQVTVISSLNWLTSTPTTTKTALFWPNES